MRPLLLPCRTAAHARTAGRRAYETDDPRRSASSLRLHHRHDHWFADAGLCQSNEGLRGRIESPLGVLDLMDRSEEHTSELQSLAYLVCRLLLEKKKK